jgi:hypothetical protein
MRDPNRSEVISAVNEGIRKAQDDYVRAYMSHIQPPYAPEYLMTVYIFQSILDLKQKCDCAYGLSLEQPVYQVVRSLRVRGRYAGEARVYGYCDLLVNSINKDKPMAVIEVKTYAWDYPQDLPRLSYLVSKGLKFGVFASCWYEVIKGGDREDAERRLNEEVQCMYEHIKEDVMRRYDGLVVETEVGGVDTLVLEGNTSSQKQEWRWCPVCFVIRGKRRR